MIKSLAFIATGVAVVLTGVAANAGPLADTVRQAGIQVKWPSNAPACNNPQLLGFYRYADRSVHVCDRGTKAEQIETVTHELVHAVQHCNAGRPLLKDNWTWAFPELTQLGYPASQLRSEAEARALEHISPKALTTLIRVYCL